MTEEMSQVPISEPLNSRPNRRNQLASFIRLTPAAENFYMPSSIPWYRDLDSMKFLFMMFLTGSYCFVELGFGIHLTSLALVADSLHMISDLVSLFIGFYA